MWKAMSLDSAAPARIAIQSCFVEVPRGNACIT
jgi:hypothetical protein